MSGDEQDAAILRIVKDRSETKRQVTLLEAELRSAGDSMADIGGALRHVNGSGSLDYIFPKIEKAPEICELGRIKSMLEELRGLRKKLDQLNRSAAELRID